MVVSVADGQEEGDYPNRKPFQVGMCNTNPKVNQDEDKEACVLQTV